MSNQQPTPPLVTGPTDRPLPEVVPPYRPNPQNRQNPQNAPAPEPSGFSYRPPPPEVAAREVPAPGATAYPGQRLPVPYESRPVERYALPPKETGLAYVFLVLFGGLGVHQFYLGKVGRGLLYIFTLGGFLGILPLVDLFTLPSQVRRVNAERAVLGR